MGQSNNQNNNVIFYHNPMSRGRVAHWMLEECGANYETKILEWTKAEHKSPEYLKINPMGKIPAIVHKGIVVPETSAICAYLADAFPNAGLAPTLNDPARGTYYRWLFFAAACLEPAMLDLKHPRANSPSAQHLGYGNYDATMNTLEKAVSNGYILGDKFSAADVFISSQIGWGLMTKDIEAKPVFRNYVRLCSDRPGFKRFTEKSGPIG